MSRLSIAPQAQPEQLSIALQTQPDQQLSANRSVVLTIINKIKILSIDSPHYDDNLKNILTSVPIEDLMSDPLWILPEQTTIIDFLEFHRIKSNSTGLTFLCAIIKNIYSKYNRCDLIIDFLELIPKTVPIRLDIIDILEIYNIFIELARLPDKCQSYIHYPHHPEFINIKKTLENKKGRQLEYGVKINIRLDFLLIILCPYFTALGDDFDILLKSWSAKNTSHINEILPTLFLYLSISNFSQMFTYNSIYGNLLSVCFCKNHDNIILTKLIMTLVFRHRVRDFLTRGNFWTTFCQQTVLVPENLQFVIKAMPIQVVMVWHQYCHILYTDIWLEILKFFTLDDVDHNVLSTITYIDT